MHLTECGGLVPHLCSYGNSLFSIDLKPPKPTKNGVTERFLNILPQTVIFVRGGAKSRVKLEIQQWDEDGG